MSCEKVVTNGEINPQVFIILQLKHLATNNLVTVMAIHLKSKVAYHQKRNAQIKYIIDRLKVHLDGSTFNVKNHALVLCGDFNGEPFEDFHSVIVNDFDLEVRDAYTFSGHPKEPTTIKKRSSNGEMIRRGIDYIFYNPSVLQLKSYLKLPKNNQLIDEQGLPNMIYSSDHLSLVADFKFK
jgi:endonuclease/exonuclease/phosphatase family metal-dependent hydrolase